jgi:hypothetical protein
LYERLLKEGRIVAPGRWDLCTLFDVNYVPKGMTGEELKRGLYWLGAALYGSEGTARRRAGFFKEWKMGRAMAV